MGYSKRQFVAAAFEEIGLASYAFDLQPQQFESALRRLDAMMLFNKKPELPQMYKEGGLAILLLILTGGLLYSVGAIFYAFKVPGKYAKYFGFHELFHIFVIAAWIRSEEHTSELQSH